MARPFEDRPVLLLELRVSHTHKSARVAIPSVVWLGASFGEVLRGIDQSCEHPLYPIQLRRLAMQAAGFRLDWRDLGSETYPRTAGGKRHGAAVILAGGELGGLDGSSPQEGREG